MPQDGAATRFVKRKTNSLGIVRVDKFTARLHLGSFRLFRNYTKQEFYTTLEAFPLFSVFTLLFCKCLNGSTEI